MNRPPNVPGSIGLPTLSTNPNRNTWNTTHNPLAVGGYGMNENVDAAMYNGYAMAPPYSGAVNSTNMPYTQ